MMGMWWSWEICLGMAGTIGVTALAAHSCVTNLTFFYFNAISATSMATAIRVGVHLGAGQTEHAICAAKAPYIIMTVVMSVVWAVCMSQRDRFGYLYTEVPEVAELASDVLPVYLAYQTCSCVNFMFKGRLDGCGRQMAFARISILSWYLVGIPVAAVTVFWWQLGGGGLWGGMCFGNMVSVAGMAVSTHATPVNVYRSPERCCVFTPAAWLRAGLGGGGTEGERAGQEQDEAAEAISYARSCVLNL